MSKVWTVSLVCILSFVIVMGCSRERAVEAAGEIGPGTDGRSQIYQPRQSPIPGDKLKTERPDIRGQLSKVNASNQTIVIRTQNGMEQTVKFDQQTNVIGHGIPTTTKVTLKPGATRIRSLMGKEGSEVSIRWRPVDEMKVANAVIVLD